jgi:MoaA/NifB/PqqE/SkfB family radical SAM enzyme
MDGQSLRHCPDVANAALDAAQQRASELGFQVVLPPRMDGQSAALPPQIRVRLLLRDLRRTRGALLVRQLRRVSHKARLARWSLQAGGRVPCHFLQGAAFVTISGDVAPCPIPGRPVAGNLHEASFREIWNGPVLTRLRTAFLRGSPEPCCAHCSQNPARHDPTDADTARPPGGLASVGVEA